MEFLFLSTITFLIGQLVMGPSLKIILWKIVWKVKCETLWTQHVASNTPALKHHLQHFCSAPHFMVSFLHNWASTPFKWLQLQKQRENERWWMTWSSAHNAVSRIFCLDFFVPGFLTNLQRCHTQIYTIWSYLKKKLFPQLQTMLVTATYSVKCPETEVNRGLNRSEERLTSRKYKSKKLHIVGNKGLKNMFCV